MVFGKLTIHYADGRRDERALARPTVSVGRAPDNDIVLDDGRAAPYHAQILCDPHGCELLDLSNGAGLQLDGAPTGGVPRPLPNGAIITIGSTRLTFSAADLLDELFATLPAAQPSPAAPAPPVAPPAAPAPPRATRSPDDPPRPLGPPRPAPTRAPQPGERPTQPLNTPAAPPPSSLAGEQYAQLAIALDTGQLEIDAGSRAQFNATITNRSEVVDDATLLVEGVPQEWVIIAPAGHQLFPRERASSNIVIQPPRKWSSAAGPHAVRVVAVSGVDQAVRAEATLTLSIRPFSQFAVALDPQKRTAWRRTQYTLRIRNEGNARERFEFDGDDAENKIDIRFAPETANVQAGREQRVATTVRLPKAPLVGREQPHEFTINVAPTAAAQPQTLPGTLVQRPPFATWTVFAAAALALLLSCVAIGYALRGPFIAGVVQPVQTAWARPGVEASAAALALAYEKATVAQGTLSAQVAEREATNAKLETVGLPTLTPLPTYTPLPTLVPLPANTAAPTYTTLPTYTPLPTQPTAANIETAVAQTQTAYADATARAALSITQAALALTQAVVATTQEAMRYTVTPSITPTPSATPTPSVTPTSNTRVIAFASLNGTAVTAHTQIPENAYQSQNVLLCFFRMQQPDSPTITPPPPPTVPAPPTITPPPPPTVPAPPTITPPPPPTIRPSPPITLTNGLSRVGAPRPDAAGHSKGADSLFAPAQQQLCQPQLAPVESYLEGEGGPRATVYNYFPALYPAFTIEPDTPAVLLTADNDDDQLVAPVAAAIIFPRGVTNARVAFWHPRRGQVVTYRLYALDEQGEVVDLAQADRLAPPGDYALDVRSQPGGRAIRTVLFVGVSGDSPGDRTRDAYRRDIYGALSPLFINNIAIPNTP